MTEHQQKKRKEEKEKFAIDHKIACELLAKEPDTMPRAAQAIAAAIQDLDPVVALFALSRAFLAQVIANGYPTAECSAVIITDVANYQSALDRIQAEKKL